MRDTLTAAMEWLWGPLAPQPSGPRAAAAETRAEALLERHLTPEQRETYRRDGWFEMRARDGSSWRIDREKGTFNVTRTSPEGTHVYCTNLRGVPRADTLLVQLLTIQATGGRGLPHVRGGTPFDEHLFERDGRGA